MRVCDAVAALAEAIESTFADRSPRQQLLIHLLWVMPLYRDIQDLGSWEAALQGAYGPTEDTTEIGLAIEQVFELGRTNLYGAFDRDRVWRKWLGVSNSLARLGIALPAVEKLAKW